MIPSKTYRITLKEGLVGCDVWALQINLNAYYRLWPVSNIAEDGDYGPQTKGRVVKFQRERGLTIDGIAGIQTQRTLGKSLLNPVESKFDVPDGLVSGIVMGESGWAVGAVSWLAPGGVDCGWVQRRVIDRDFSEPAFRTAFHGPGQFESVCQKLRNLKNGFFGDPGAKTHRRAWELAVLDHNWPSAAAKYASGLTNWTYSAVDQNAVRRTYFMSDSAYWVKRIGVPGVETGHEWAAYYVHSKTGQVTHWSV